MVGDLVRWLRARVLPAAAVLLGASAPRPALAQSVELTVNGDPITTADVDQAMLMRRILHLPASRADAVEALVADRLKLHEANKYGIDASDADLQTTLNQIAAQGKLNAQSFSLALQKGKASTDVVRDHLHATAAWNNYVRARNKMINVSDAEISTAIAKDPGRAQDTTELTLQEIVFVTPVKATVGEIEGRMRQAQALRGRFTDCGTGLALARALPDVAVKDAFRRDAKSLSETARKAIDGTPSGHLTPPERSTAGVSMIAVCSKNQDADRTTIRDSVQADLIKARLTGISDKMYKQLRATAVIDKH